MIIVSGYKLIRHLIAKNDSPATAGPSIFAPCNFVAHTKPSGDTGSLRLPVIKTRRQLTYTLLVHFYVQSKSSETKLNKPDNPDNRFSKFSSPPYREKRQPRYRGTVDFRSVQLRCTHTTLRGYRSCFPVPFLGPDPQSRILFPIPRYHTFPRFTVPLPVPILPVPDSGYFLLFPISGPRFPVLSPRPDF